MGAICCAEGSKILQVTYAQQIKIQLALILGKQEIDTDGGLQPDRLRGRLSSGAGITSNDIFGDQLIDIDENQDELMGEFKNKWETNVKITPKHIIELLETIKMQDSQYGKYDMKLNEDKLKIAIRNKGSDLAKDIPVFWTTFIFDKGATIPAILKAIYNPEERTKWDKDITEAEILRFEAANTVKLWHQKSRSSNKYISIRDYLEKKVKFTNSNKRYVYFSSLPDQIQEADDASPRAYTIFGVHSFERLEDGRIQMEAISQIDYNVGVGAIGKVALNTITSAQNKLLKTWYTTLEDYVREMINPGRNTPQ